MLEISFILKLFTLVSCYTWLQYVKKYTSIQFCDYQSQLFHILFIILPFSFLENICVPFVLKIDFVKIDINPPTIKVYTNQCLNFQKNYGIKSNLMDIN